MAKKKAVEKPLMPMTLYVVESDAEELIASDNLEDFINWVGSIAEYKLVGEGKIAASLELTK
jgi:hypothetical protein